ncbi:MAG: DUF748 domain-containing protein [bacterium]|nr:DUF748 domain-containing protein [bacterium]
MTANEPQPETANANADHVEPAASDQAADVVETAATATLSKPKPRKRRRWRRALAWLVVLVVVARIGLELALPRLIEYGVTFGSLEGECASASLSLFGGSVRLQRVHLRDPENGEHGLALAVHELAADVSTWQLLSGELVVSDAVLRGVRLDAWRRPDGSFVLPSAWTAPAAEPEPEPEPEAEPGAPSATLPFQIAGARIHDLRLGLRSTDGSRPPLELVIDADIDDVGRRDRPGQLALRLAGEGLADRIELTAEVHSPADGLTCDARLLAHGLDLDRLVPELGIAPLHFDLHTRLELAVIPATADATAAGTSLHSTITIERAPALAKALAITADGTFHGDGQSEFAVELTGRGIVLEPLRDLLQGAGIEFEAGGLDLTAHATTAAAADGATNLRVHDVRVGNDQHALTLDELRVDALRSREDGGLDIGGVTIVGPATALTRQADGSLSVAGVRLLAAPAAPPPRTPAAVAEAASGGAQPNTDPAASPTAPGVPPIVLAKLDWRGAAVAFQDLTHPASPTLAFENLTLSGSDLACGCDRDPGQAELTIELPGIAQRLTANLALQPQPGGAHLETTLDVDGITLARLAPWLEPAGIAPAFDAARLHGAVVVDVAGEGRAERVSARLANLRFTAGDTVFASVRNLELDELRLDHPGLAFERLDLLEPVVHVTRQPEATIVAGLRIAATPPSAPATQPNAEAGNRPLLPTVVATPSQPATSAPVAATPPAKEPLELATGPIRLRGATLHIRDETAETKDATAANAATKAIGLDVELGAMRGTGREALATPVPFAVTLHLDQKVDALGLKGSLTRSAAGTRVTASLAGRGLRGQALAPVLPAGIRSPLTDGALTGELQFVANAENTAFEVTLEQLRLLDGSTELAGIDRIVAAIPTVTSELIHVGKVRIEGVRARAASTPDGLQVPGFLLGAPATAGDESRPRTPVADNAAAAGPATITAPPAGAMLPALRLDDVAIVVDELEWTDRRDPAHDGTPVRAQLALRLTEPWRTAEDFAATPPLRFELRAGAAPVLKQLGVDLAIAPFALAPTLDVTVDIEDLDTTQLPNVMPALAATLQGTETGVDLALHLHSELELGRQEPTHFDLSRPFGGTFVVEHLAVRDTAGAAMVTLPSLEAELRAFDPRTGDVLFRSIEIDSPQLAAARTPAGLAVAGFLLPDPPPPAAAAPEPDGKGPNPEDPNREDPSGEIPNGKPAPEFAIDSLRLFGLGVTWRDATTTPATHLPIEDLDVSLQRFSTRALTEPRRFAFEASVRGGLVELERRIVRSSVFAGIAGSATDLVTGTTDQHEKEQRPLLDELTVKGHLQLHPLTLGRIDTELRGFELQALRGLAKPAGVDIADGVLDATIGMDFTQKGVGVKTQKTFTWLQVSEPPGGPISTYLKLPAPLDVVLFALRNDNDEQQLPLQLFVPNEGDSTTRIVQAAAETLTLLIGDAIASSPFRAARSLTDVFGLTGRDDIATPPAEITFAPGSATPDLTNLEPFLAELQDRPTVKFVLRHELGAADRERVAALANPQPELTRQSIARLTAERDALAAARDRLAPQVRIRLLAGQHHAAAPAFAELRRIDGDLAAVQETLDVTRDLLDNDSDRHRRRRIRRAATNLGELRLLAVREELERRLGPDRPAVSIQVRAARGVVAAGVDVAGRILIEPRK